MLTRSLNATSYGPFQYITENGPLASFMMGLTWLRDSLLLQKNVEIGQCSRVIKLTLHIEKRYRHRRM